jgi:hypothetical protein
MGRVLKFSGFSQGLPENVVANSYFSHLRNCQFSDPYVLRWLTIRIPATVAITKLCINRNKPRTQPATHTSQSSIAKVRGYNYKYIYRKINVNILCTDVSIKSVEIMMTASDLKTKQLMTELCNLRERKRRSVKYSCLHVHFRPSPFSSFSVTSDARNERRAIFPKKPTPLKYKYRFQLHAQIASQSVLRPEYRKIGGLQEMTCAEMH